MPNAFDEFDAPPRNAFDEFDNPLSQEQLDAVARGKARAAALARGVPIQLPPGHNAPDLPQVMSDGSEGIGAYAKSFVEGMPIAGPLLEKGTRAAAAGMLAPFSERDFGELYDQMGRAGASAQFRNPGISTAGNVSGAVVGTLPMIAAAPEAFGVGAGNLGTRSGVSALSSAGIGGADAAVRSGGDPQAIWNGTWKGGAAGLAGPLAGEVIGAGMRGLRSGGTALADALLGSRMVGDTGLSRGATKVLSRAMEADRLTPEALQQRMADLGPGAMVADAGPNLQQTAGALVTMPGEGRAIVQTAIRERDAGATGRILSAMDENLGRASTPSRIEAGLDESKAALGPSYDDALTGAGPVNLAEIAEGLDRQIMNLKGDPLRAAQQARAMLNVNGRRELETSPAAALQMRHALDDAFANATGNSTRSLLGDVRRQIDNELGRVAPAIKDVDAQFAELSRQGEGLKRGGQVLDTGKTAIRPDELADEMTAGVQPQGQSVGPSAATFQMREGTRADLARIVGTNARDRAKLQSLIAGEGDWNPAKLRQMFGTERADRMLQVLDAEKVFADTANAVTQNSATVARQQGVKALEGVGDDGFGFGDSAVIGGASGIAIKGAAKIADSTMKAFSKIKNEAIRAQLAQALVGEDAAPMLQAITSQQGRRLTSQELAQREAIKRAILFSPAFAAGR